MTGHVLQMGVANRLIFFLLVSATDHISGVPGLTLATMTMILFANSATSHAAAGQLWDLGHGIYCYALTAADVANIGPLWIHIDAPGCDPTDVCFQVVGYDPYNSTNLGLAAIPPVAMGTAGCLPQSPSGSGDVLVGSYLTAANPATLVWGAALGNYLAAGTAALYVYDTHSVLVGLVSTSDNTQITAHALALAPTGSGGGADPWSVPLPGPYPVGTAGFTVGILTGLVTAPNYNQFSALALSLAPSGGGGSATDPWSTQLPGGYAGGSAGSILGHMQDPWQAAAPGGYAAGTFGSIVYNNLDAKVSTRSTYAGGPVASVTAPVTVGAYSGAGIPADPWATQIPGGYAAGTAGYVLGSRLDVLVSSRSTYAGGDTPGTTTLVGLLTPARAANLDRLDVAVSTRSTYAGGDTPGTTTLVGLLTPTRAANLDRLDVAVSTRSTYAGGPVTVGGYAAGQDPATLVLNASMAAHLGVGTVGYSIAVASADPWAVALPGGYTAGMAGYVLGNLGGGGSGTDPWATALPGSYAAGTAGAILAILPGLVSTSDATQFTAHALAAAPTGSGGGGADPWAISLPGAYPAGTAGAILGGRLDVAVSTRSTYAGADTAGTTTLLALLTPTRAANLDNLDVAVSTRSTYAGADTPGTATLLSLVTPARAANLDNLDVAVSTRSTYAGGPVASVTGPVTVGGYAAGAAPADPWATALPGSYAAGTAGAILGTNLDTTVSSRSIYAGGPVASVTAPVTVGGYSAGAFPADPWAAALPGSYAAGTAGQIVGSRLDAAISTRSTYAGGPVAAVVGSVGSVTAPVVVGGYAAGAAPIDPWTITVPAAYPAGTAGYILGNRLDVAVSTRSTYAGGDTPGTAALAALLTPARAANLDFLDVAVSTRSTYAGGAVASVTAPVTVAAIQDKAGYSLAATGLDAIGTAQPPGVATTFREMVVATWRRFYMQGTKDPDTGTIRTYGDDGVTVLTTQDYAEDTSGAESMGPSR